MMAAAVAAAAAAAARRSVTACLQGMLLRLHAGNLCRAHGAGLLDRPCLHLQGGMHAVRFSGSHLRQCTCRYTQAQSALPAG